MDNVLYRKYRAKDFSQIIGQDKIKSILTSAIATNKISHAYLFCGPRGTGKTSVARLFAKAVNCLNFDKNKDVCNECENCLLINDAKVVDIIEMDAASNRGIEEIRNLKETISYLPTSLKYKIYIIDEAHMLTKEAFNALLKTLEEPPSHVLFILATTEPHKIPVTILSRLQRFDFSLAGKDQLRTKLTYILNNEQVEFEDSVLDLIYDFTGGSYRDAESLLGKIIGEFNTLNFESVKQLLGVIPNEEFGSLTKSLIAKDFINSINTLENIYQSITEVSTILDQYLNYLKNSVLNSEFNIEDILEIINEVINTKKYLRDFEDGKTILQIMVMNICAGRVQSEESNVKKISVKNKNLKVEMQDKAMIEEDEPAKTKNGERINNKQPIVEITETYINNEAGATKNSSEGLRSVELIEYVREKSHPRLNAILEASNIILTESYLIIQNKYKFNIQFLEKVENIKLFNEYLKSTNNKGLKVRIEKIDFEPEVITKDQIEKNEKITKEEEIEDEPQVDNSNLVESLLL